MRSTPEGGNNTPLSAPKQRSKAGIIGGLVASAVLSACGGGSDTSERQVTVLDPINVPANSSKDIAVVQVEGTCENPTITIENLPDGITVGNGVWDQKTNTFTVPVTVDRKVLPKYTGEATATIRDTCPVDTPEDETPVESASVVGKAQASAYAVRPLAYESTTTTMIASTPIVVKVAKETVTPPSTMLLEGSEFSQLSDMTVGDHGGFSEIVIQTGGVRDSAGKKLTYTITQGTLPTGLVLDPGTGEIRGFHDSYGPQGGGTSEDYTITETVSNGESSESRNFVLSIRDDG